MAGAQVDWTAAQTARGVHYVAPEIFEKVEAPQIVTVFSDHGGVAQGNGVVVTGRHFAMKSQLGLNIPVHSAAAEELQKESAHRWLPPENSRDGRSEEHTSELQS